MSARLPVVKPQKDRFAAADARCCPLSRKPFPPKLQSFRTTAENQRHSYVVPTSSLCCSRFIVVFSPFYYRRALAYLQCKLII